ncbi:hypothetical protein [Empedobacter sp. UBA6305]|uniref:hypothetical protein n=1 Tax=Empedobacter sp. UBA6305 TaxID=1946445 RepID=UPI0025C73B18|nr:hypothetical protein [Empedobacter sp. UBA6305]
MNFKEIKKIYNLTNEKMADIFGIKSADAFKNSSAKKRYEEAVVKLYEIFKEK